MVMVWEENLERGLLERFISVLRNDNKLYPSAEQFLRKPWGVYDRKRMEKSSQ